MKRFVLLLTAAVSLFYCNFSTVALAKRTKKNVKNEPKICSTRGSATTSLPSATSVPKILLLDLDTLLCELFNEPEGMMAVQSSWESPLPLFPRVEEDVQLAEDIVRVMESVKVATCSRSWTARPGEERVFLSAVSNIVHQMHYLSSRLVSTPGAATSYPNVVSACNGVLRILHTCIGHYVKSYGGSGFVDSVMSANLEVYIPSFFYFACNALNTNFRVRLIDFVFETFGRDYHDQLWDEYFRNTSPQKGLPFPVHFVEQSLIISVTDASMVAALVDRWMERLLVPCDEIKLFDSVHLANLGRLLHYNYITLPRLEEILTLLEDRGLLAKANADKSVVAFFDFIMSAQTLQNKDARYLHLVVLTSSTDDSQLDSRAQMEALTRIWNRVLGQISFDECSVKVYTELIQRVQMLDMCFPGISLDLHLPQRGESFPRAPMQELARIAKMLAEHRKDAHSIEDMTAFVVDVLRPKEIIAADCCVWPIEWELMAFAIETLKIVYDAYAVNNGEVEMKLMEFLVEHVCAVILTEPWTPPPLGFDAMRTVRVLVDVVCLAESDSFRAVLNKIYKLVNYDEPLGLAYLRYFSDRIRSTGRIIGTMPGVPRAITSRARHGAVMELYEAIAASYSGQSFLSMNLFAGMFSHLKNMHTSFETLEGGLAMLLEHKLPFSFHKRILDSTWLFINSAVFTSGFYGCNEETLHANVYGASLALESVRGYNVRIVHLLLRHIDMYLGTETGVEFERAQSLLSAQDLVLDSFYQTLMTKTEMRAVISDEAEPITLEGLDELQPSRSTLLVRRLFALWIQIMTRGIRAEHATFLFIRLQNLSTSLASFSESNANDLRFKLKSLTRMSLVSLLRTEEIRKSLTKEMVLLLCDTYHQTGCLNQCSSREIIAASQCCDAMDVVVGRLVKLATDTNKLPFQSYNIFDFDLVNPQVRHDLQKHLAGFIFGAKQVVIYPVYVFIRWIQMGHVDADILLHLFAVIKKRSDDALLAYLQLRILDAVFGCATLDDAIKMHALESVFSDAFLRTTLKARDSEALAYCIGFLAGTDEVRQAFVRSHCGKDFYPELVMLIARLHLRMQHFQVPSGEQLLKTRPSLHLLLTHHGVETVMQSYRAVNRAQDTLLNALEVRSYVACSLECNCGVLLLDMTKYPLGVCSEVLLNNLVQAMFQTFSFLTGEIDQNLQTLLQPALCIRMLRVGLKYLLSDETRSFFVCSVLEAFRPYILFHDLLECIPGCARVETLLQPDVFTRLIMHRPSSASLSRFFCAVADVFLPQTHDDAPDVFEMSIRSSMYPTISPVEPFFSAMMVLASNVHIPDKVHADILKRMLSYPHEAALLDPSIVLYMEMVVHQKTLVEDDNENGEAMQMWGTLGGARAREDRRVIAELVADLLLKLPMLLYEDLGEDEDEQFERWLQLWSAVEKLAPERFKVPGALKLLRNLDRISISSVQECPVDEFSKLSDVIRLDIVEALMRNFKMTPAQYATAFDMLPDTRGFENALHSNERVPVVADFIVTIFEERHPLEFILSSAPSKIDKLLMLMDVSLTEPFSNDVDMSKFWSLLFAKAKEAHLIAVLEGALVVKHPSLLKTISDSKSVLLFLGALGDLTDIDEPYHECLHRLYKKGGAVYDELTETKSTLLPSEQHAVVVECHLLITQLADKTLVVNVDSMSEWTARFEHLHMLCRPFAGTRQDSWALQIIELVCRCFVSLFASSEECLRRMEDTGRLVDSTLRLLAVFVEANIVTMACVLKTQYVNYLMYFFMKHVTMAKESYFTVMRAIEQFSPRSLMQVFALYISTGEVNPAQCLISAELAEHDFSEITPRAAYSSIDLVEGYVETLCRRVEGEVLLDLQHVRIIGRVMVSWRMRHQEKVRLLTRLLSATLRTVTSEGVLSAWLDVFAEMTRELTCSAFLVESLCKSTAIEHLFRTFQNDEGALEGIAKLLDLFRTTQKDASSECEGRLPEDTRNQLAAVRSRMTRKQEEPEQSMNVLMNWIPRIKNVNMNIPKTLSDFVTSLLATKIHSARLPVLERLRQKVLEKLDEASPPISSNLAHPLVAALLFLLTLCPMESSSAETCLPVVKLASKLLPPAVMLKFIESAVLVCDNDMHAKAFLLIVVRALDMDALLSLLPRLVDANLMADLSIFVDAAQRSSQERVIAFLKHDSVRGMAAAHKLALLQVAQPAVDSDTIKMLIVFAKGLLNKKDTTANGAVVSFLLTNKSVLSVFLSTDKNSSKNRAEVLKLVSDIECNDHHVYESSPLGHLVWRMNYCELEDGELFMHDDVADVEKFMETYMLDTVNCKEPAVRISRTLKLLRLHWETRDMQIGEKWRRFLTSLFTDLNKDLNATHGRDFVTACAVETVIYEFGRMERPDMSLRRQVLWNMLSPVPKLSVLDAVLLLLVEEERPDGRFYHTLVENVSRAAAESQRSIVRRLLSYRCFFPAEENRSELKTPKKR